MPYASDRSVRLFYDDSCGPCRVLARPTEAVSRHRVVPTPFTTPSAGRELQHLTSEVRYGYAHLAAGGSLRTGHAFAARLVGLALGPTWESVVRRVPPLERSLRWVSLRLWEDRRARGCGARTSR